MNTNYKEVSNRIEFTTDAVNFLRDLIGAHGARIMRQSIHHKRLLGGENSAYHERMLRYYKDAWSYLRYIISQSDKKWSRHELIAGGLMVDKIIDQVIPKIADEVSMSDDKLIGENDEI